MALNKARVNKNRQSAGGGDFGKLEDGRNVVRIHSFKHIVTESDMGLFYDKNGSYKVGDVVDELDRIVFKHFRGKDSFNCQHTPDCVGCLEAEPFKGASDKNGQKMYRELSARKQHYLNASFPEGQDPNKIFLLPIPPSVYQGISSYVLDEDYGEAILGNSGRDFIITKNTKLEPAKMYDVKLRDADKSRVIEAGDGYDLYDCAPLNDGFGLGGHNNSEEDGEVEKPASAPAKPAPAKPAPAKAATPAPAPAKPAKAVAPAPVKATPAKPVAPVVTAEQSDEIHNDLPFEEKSLEVDSEIFCKLMGKNVRVKIVANDGEFVTVEYKGEQYELSIEEVSK